ncbi:MAG: PAS domain S-box-containing protein [Candidatus Azotimanducaceae bacterium]|jgi:PAS domain S-box-containing protein
MFAADTHQTSLRIRSCSFMGKFTPLRSITNQSLLTGPLTGLLTGSGSPTSSAGRPIRPILMIIGILAIGSLGLLMNSIVSATALVAFCVLIVCVGLLLKLCASLLEQNSDVLHFEETLEALTDIYWIWDLQTGEFQYNGIMSELLGYDDRKPSDAFWKEIIHPIDRSLQKYYLLRHLKDEAVPYYCEYRFLDRNQEYQWFAGRGKVVRRDQQQRPLFMIGSVEHIQPRKDMEQNLIHAHKMEALGQLTGGIAHDFNNILATVLGYAELSVDSDSPVKMQEYAEQIHVAGSRARNVVRQLLDFSRSSKGETIALDLKQEIEDSILMIRSTMPATIEIKSHWPDVPCLSILDPNQLQRVLLNLCINARDAMSGNGQMTISLTTQIIEQQVCASCQQEFTGAYNRLTVSDTGSGVQEHFKNKVFEPFFTTKPFGEGTGMGLSVVHGIVHECGGHIAISSEIDTGTEVSLYFPDVSPSTSQIELTQ